MIGRIAGILLEKNPPHLLVDCNGVGYEIDVPMSTFYNLPQTGERVVLLTQQIVREDAHLLYGFLTPQERTTFRELLKITGIGARMALAVLSGMSVQELAQAVTMQDAARLTRLPGIGKKTAERLLLELKGKLGAISVRSPAPRRRPIMPPTSSTRCSRSATPKRKRSPQSRTCRPAPACPKASSSRSRHCPRRDARVSGRRIQCRPAARRLPVGRSAR